MGAKCRQSAVTDAGAQLLSGLAGRTHPFAWFSEGKAGPSLAPWSPEAQVAPVLAYQPP